MQKIKYFLGLILFYLFIPNVNAISYDIKTDVSSLGNNKYEIKLTLADMKDIEDGFESCYMNIEFSEGVKLNGDVRTIGNWNLEKGEIYLFDTSTPVKTNTSFSIIPVSVSSNGTVTLKNIFCFADEEEIEISQKVVNLTYTEGTTNNNTGSSSNSNNGSSNNSNNNGSNNNNVITENKNDKNEDDSNCNLTDIILNEGTIEFDSNITEYEVYVDDIDSLMVEPKLSNPKARYNVTQIENKIIIEVTAVDGTKKNYTLFVVQEENEEIKEEKDNKYVPIFIGIICVLVLINIIRIVKNLIKKG